MCSRQVHAEWEREYRALLTHFNANATLLRSLVEVEQPIRAACLDRLGTADGGETRRQVFTALDALAAWDKR